MEGNKKKNKEKIGDERGTVTLTFFNTFLLLWTNCNIACYKKLVKNQLLSHAAPTVTHDMKVNPKCLHYIHTVISLYKAIHTNSTGTT